MRAAASGSRPRHGCCLLVAELYAQCSMVCQSTPRAVEHFNADTFGVVPTRTPNIGTIISRRKSRYFHVHSWRRWPTSIGFKDQASRQPSLSKHWSSPSRKLRSPATMKVWAVSLSYCLLKCRNCAARKSRSSDLEPDSVCTLIMLQRPRRTVNICRPFLDVGNAYEEHLS